MVGPSGLFFQLLVLAICLVVILPRAHALCSAKCVLVQRSSSISMTAAGRTAATLSEGPAAMLVMAQAASKAVFSSTALYCLQHVIVTSV